MKKQKENFGRLIQLFVLCTIFTHAKSVSDANAYEKFWISSVTLAELVTQELGDRIHNFTQSLNQTEPVGITFECLGLNDTEKATSVHRLKPSDIEFVAALGDSLTAGNAIGATTVLTSLLQWKGRSFAMGGDETVDTVGTIPNILKEYSLTVDGLDGYGEGVCTTITKIPDGFTPPSLRQCTDGDDTRSDFNVAEFGAMGLNLPNQAEELVRKMERRLTRIEMRDSWKMVTILIGNNDMCNYCRKRGVFPIDRDNFNPDRFIGFLNQAIHILKDNLPKTFVSVLLTPDIPQLSLVRSPKCSLIHRLVCPCSTVGDLQPPRDLLSEYHRGMWNLLVDEDYDTEEFAVVLQPFAHSTTVPLTEEGEADKSYFAPDCFHFSSKTHASTAAIYWNNLLEPVGNKSLRWDPSIDTNIKCPTDEEPYFYTSQNSNYTRVKDQMPWDPINATRFEQPVYDAVVDIVELFRTCLPNISDFYYNASLQLREAIEDARLPFKEVVLDGIDTLNVTCTDLIPVQPSTEPIYSFPCSIIKSSENVPKSVHELRPGDIKVIAALGDSLTAGSGLLAKTLAGTFVSWRGAAFSIGGDNTYESVQTLPNYLRLYNPQLVGFSTSAGYVNNPNSNLNVGFFGANGYNMPQEALELVERMKNFPGIDFEKDWKVITIFVGANDLCDFCDPKEEYLGDSDPENFIYYLRQALNTLYDNIPRAFVNLINTISVADVSVFQTKRCRFIHGLSCKCPTYEAPFGDKYKSIEYVERYWELSYELIDTGRYERDDFTVVIQPFFEDLTLPQLEDGSYDDSLFAPDCFHLNQKGHSLLALALWNSMFQPVGSKTTYDWTTDTICPTEESPYLATKKNSDYEECPQSPSSSSSSSLGLTTWELVGVMCAVAFGGIVIGFLVGLCVLQSASSAKAFSAGAKSSSSVGVETNNGKENYDNNNLEMKSEQIVEEAKL